MAAKPRVREPAPAPPAPEATRRKRAPELLKSSTTETRTAERLLREDERKRRTAAAGAPAEPLTPEEEEFLDALDEADVEAVELAGGIGARQVEIYEHVPPPTGRRRLATFERTGTEGELRDAVVAACQDAGRWGNLDLLLTWKVPCPGTPHKTHSGRVCRGRPHLAHIVRNVGHYGLSVPWTEAAAAAAATRASAAVAPGGPSAQSELLPLLLKPLVERATAPPPDPVESFNKFATALGAIADKQGGPWKELVAAAAPILPQLVNKLFAPPPPLVQPALLTAAVPFLAAAANRLFESPRAETGGEWRDMMEFIRVVRDEFGGGEGTRRLDRRLQYPGAPLGAGDAQPGPRTGRKLP